MTVTVEATATSGRQLLESIERGDEVELLKDGLAVARVVPQVQWPFVVTPERRALAEQALRDIDALSSELSLGPFNFEEFKADRDTGRR